MSRRGVYLELTLVYLGTLGVVVLLKAYLNHPVVAQLFRLIYLGLFLGLPLALLRWRRLNLADYGLTVERWRTAALVVLVLVAATFPFFVLAFHFTNHLFYHPNFVARMPGGWLNFIPSQFLLIALSEEAFYRGYLQGRLDDLFPRRIRLLGAPVGAGLVLAAALFALGHLVDFHPKRLGVFFPALTFGWLRARTGSILAPVLFHGLCNTLMAALELAYYGE